MGQLIREDNVPLFKTFTYSYDDAGNILEKKEYTLSVTTSLGAFQFQGYYTYSADTWGDRLSFSYYSDGYGENIEYDAIGNPTLIGSTSMMSTISTPARISIGTAESL